MIRKNVLSYQGPSSETRPPPSAAKLDVQARQDEASITVIFKLVIVTSWVSVLRTGVLHFGFAGLDLHAETIQKIEQIDFLKTNGESKGQAEFFSLFSMNASRDLSN